MTTATLSPATQDKPHLFTQLTALAIALLVLTLLWSLIDPRLLDGVPVWLKPAKFSLSFVIHFGTLALIVTALSPDLRRSRHIAVAGSVMAVSFMVEMAYLFLQAAQAQHSHFNLDTTFHLVAYQIMGIGAVLLIVMPVLVAHVAQRETAFGPNTRQGIWWGALLSLGLTLVVAGYLSSGTGHFVGTPSPGAATLPLFGWSAEVGDLRPAHFLSLHALQVLPLLGLWADRSGRSGAVIPLAATLYGLATAAVFVQALMGLPLIRL
jgi:hypothetical protein